MQIWIWTQSFLEKVKSARTENLSSDIHSSEKNEARCYQCAALLMVCSTEKEVVWIGLFELRRIAGIVNFIVRAMILLVCVGWYFNVSIASRWVDWNQEDFLRSSIINSKFFKGSYDTGLHRLLCRHRQTWYCWAHWAYIVALRKVLSLYRQKGEDTTARLRVNQSLLIGPICGLAATVSVQHGEIWVPKNYFKADLLDRARGVISKEIHQRQQICNAMLCILEV